MKPRCILNICMFALLCLLSGAALAQVITEFGVGSRPGSITAGPDGNLWFTLSDRIGRITPLGVVTEFSAGISAGAGPQGITAGPDGNLWFTEYYGNRIGRITPLGVVTEFSAGISAGAGPDAITAGPDGNLWFSEYPGNRIGRITPLGVVTEFSAGITANANIFSITAGPDGNVWFTEDGGRRIGRITPLGVVTEFSTGPSDSQPFGITAGPDGNLWFAKNSLFDVGITGIGRITPLGVVTEFSGVFSAPFGITAGADGNLWFTDPDGNRIGRITPLGVVTVFRTGMSVDSEAVVITAGPDGNLWFTQPYGNRIGRITTGAEQVATPNYTGLFWNSPAGSASGWGVSFAHQGDVIFAAWFTYDLNGKGWWLVMTAPNTGGNTFSGTLFEVTGPAFDAVPFDPTQVTRTAVGTGTLNFNGADYGTFAYTVNGISQTKAITREVFGPQESCVFGAQPDLTLATNYQDLWWNAPGESESGWGINLAHEGDTIFATWFTYDHDRMPMWLVATATKTMPATYAGTLYRTTGPPFNAVPFNPAAVARTAVGNASFTFANGNSAMFTYTVNTSNGPVTQTKSITRQVFRAPGTVCQ